MSSPPAPTSRSPAHWPTGRSNACAPAASRGATSACGHWVENAAAGSHARPVILGLFHCDLYPYMKTPTGLRELIDEGVIDEVLRPLKSGKEASVYVVRSGDQVRC